MEMAKWLRRASQGYDMHALLCSGGHGFLHGLSPGQVELGGA